MRPRNAGQRLADLAEAIDAADEVLALARHPAVAEWFERREQALIEEMIAADEHDLQRAQLRIAAHREMLALVSGIEATRASNLRRYDDLRKLETTNAR